MAETATKLPAAQEGRTPETATAQRRNPVDILRHQIDRLFEDFRPFGWNGGLDRRMPSLGGRWPVSFAVDLVENESNYEITAELPGMEEKEIDVELSDGWLVIRGEKSDNKEQKEKDYYLSERHFGSFQRAFQLPEAVDQDKIEASFAKGVLTVRLPKGAKAPQSAKKISVTAA